jgi:hypothetical protein
MKIGRKPSGCGLGKDGHPEALCGELSEHYRIARLERDPRARLTSTWSRDGTGGRVQVARRQPDGSWLRIIDRPEVAR